MALKRSTKVFALSIVIIMLLGVAIVMHFMLGEGSPKTVSQSASYQLSQSQAEVIPNLTKEAFEERTKILQAKKPVIDVGNQKVSVSVAHEEADREKGLSGTLSLKDSEGKLFVFDSSNRYGFWMKDMNYALDMIWIDSEFTVDSVSANATPESFPKVFLPQNPVMYVLEVPAGFAERHGVGIGTKITFDAGND